MDYCKGGDLAGWNSRFQQFICKWPIPTLVRYLWQAAEGIAYCMIICYVSALERCHPSGYQASEYSGLRIRGCQGSRFQSISHSVWTSCIAEGKRRDLSFHGAWSTGRERSCRIRWQEGGYVGFWCQHLWNIIQRPSFQFWVSARSILANRT